MQTYITVNGRAHACIYTCTVNRQHSLTSKPMCRAACCTVSRGTDTLSAPIALNSANSNGKHLDAPNTSAPDMAGTSPALGPTNTRRIVADGSTPWVDACSITLRMVEANAHAASVSAFSQSARAWSVWLSGIAAVSTMIWMIKVMCVSMTKFFKKIYSNF